MKPTAIRMLILGSTALCSSLSLFLPASEANAQDFIAVTQNASGADGQNRTSYAASAGQGSGGGDIGISGRPPTNFTTSADSAFSYLASGGKGGDDSMVVGNAPGDQAGVNSFGGSGGHGGKINLTVADSQATIFSKTSGGGAAFSLSSDGGRGGDTVTYGRGGAGGAAGVISISGSLSDVSPVYPVFLSVSAKGGGGGNAERQTNTRADLILTRLGQGGAGGAVTIDVKGVPNIGGLNSAFAVDVRGGDAGTAFNNQTNAIGADGGAGGTINLKYKGYGFNPSALSSVSLQADGGQGSPGTTYNYAFALQEVQANPTNKQFFDQNLIGKGGNGGNGGSVTAVIELIDGGYPPSSIVSALAPAISASANGGAGGGATTKINDLGGGGGGGGGVGGNGGAVTLRVVGGEVRSPYGGILAVSAGGGGGGGAASSSPFFAKGGSAASGGSGGDVSVTSSASILVDGDAAFGIRAISGGGGSGAGGAAKVILGYAEGASGGQAMPGGTAYVNNSGALTLQGNLTSGIQVASIGGGGGVGGASSALSASVDLPWYSIGLLPSAVEVAIGGAGGGGGDGGYAEGANSGKITTNGGMSSGVGVLSVGGGGGFGGVARSVSQVTADPSGGVPALSVAVTVGGQGGGGGNGGQAIARNDGTIITTGISSFGMQVQSIGGGGGAGGKVESAATTSNEPFTNSGTSYSFAVAVALGGKGGGGGSGGEVSATMPSSGSIYTRAALSPGVFAQSVGGGGGVGGEAIAKTKNDDATTLNVALTESVGGSGDVGGNGGAVTVRNSGSIVTMGDASPALQAQSVGGGGGNGGVVKGSSDAGGGGAYEFNVKKGEGAPKFDSMSFSATLAVGGSGKGGGQGGDVDVTNDGGAALLTAGNFSRGIFAQSVGGGGGNGGSSNVTTGGGTIRAQMALGGSGGKGGDGRNVTITNASALVMTFGAQATAVEAQSVGGGGGSGGVSVVAPEQANAVDDVGLSTGKWVKAGVKNGVSSALTKKDKDGNITFNKLSEMSREGFGTAAVNTVSSQLIKTINASLPVSLMPGVSIKDGEAKLKSIPLEMQLGTSLGGKGGVGGSGGDVTVNNQGDTLLLTAGDGSSGVLAQSVGGGGGDAGVASSKGGPGGTIISYIFEEGASNGSPGNGGKVTVSNGASLSDGGLVVTMGTYSHGIVAQSLGGGGGFAFGAMTDPAPDRMAINLKVGGLSGGNGGEANVTNYGGVYTLGSASQGVLAQSVGSGGGVTEIITPGFTSGSWQLTADAKNNPSMIVLGALTQQTGKYQEISLGNGGNVNVDNYNLISTLGYASNAIFAQSVGGGGGLIIAPLAGASSYIPISIGGAGIGNGGDVLVNNRGVIETAGLGAHGIVAQSVGGGGGYMILGGGGGVAAFRPATPPVAFNVWDDRWRDWGANKNIPETANQYAGLYEAGKVTVEAMSGSSIATSGQNAFGILAQSVGRGGGVIDGGTEVYQVVNGIPGKDMAERTGAGKNVTVTVNTGATVETKGDGAVGVFAQSVGGGGGLVLGASSIAYDLSKYSNQLSPFSPTASTMGSKGGGFAGLVNVTVAGTVITNGDYAPGVMALSQNGFGVAASTPVFGADAAGVKNAPSFFFDGAIGSVGVTVDGKVMAKGRGSPGVFAVTSLGASNQVGNVSVTASENSYISGGTLLQGYGIYTVSTGDTKIVIGKNATVTSSTDTYSTIKRAIFASTIDLQLSALQRTSIINNGNIVGDINIAANLNQTNTGEDKPLEGITYPLVNYGVISGAQSISIVGLPQSSVSLGTFFNNGVLLLGSPGPNQLPLKMTGNYLQSYREGSFVQGSVPSSKGALVVNVSDPGAVGGRPALIQVSGAMQFNDSQDTSFRGNPDSNIGINVSEIKRTGIHWIQIATANKVTYPGGNGNYAVMFDGAVPRANASADNMAFKYYIHVDPQGISLEPRSTVAAVVKGGRLAGMAEALDKRFNAAAAADSTELRGGPAPAELTDVQEVAYAALERADGGGGVEQILSRVNNEAPQLLDQQAEGRASEFTTRMFSCPTFGDQGAGLRERDCVWTRGIANLTLQDAGTGTGGYRSETVGWQVGGQKEVAPDILLMASAGFEQSWIKSRSTPSSSTGQAYDIGVGFKWQPGQWLFGAGLAYSVGNFDNTRYLSLLDVTDKVTSSHRLQDLTARLRGAYQLPFERWYVKPILDLDFSYAWTPSYVESGAGELNLSYDRYGAFFFTASPSVEIGGRFDIRDDMTLRAYGSVGMRSTFGDWNPRMRFAGDLENSFKVSVDTPKTYGVATVGVELMTADGFDLRTEYAVRASVGYQSHTGTLRLSYRY